MTKKLIEALIELYNAASAVQGDGHLYASLQHAAEVIGEAQRVENMPPALKAAARIKAGVYTYAVLETAAAELARLHPYEELYLAWEEKTKWLRDPETAVPGVHRADVLRHRIDQLTKERDAALEVAGNNAYTDASWSSCVRYLRERVALLEARQKCQRMGLQQIAEPADANLLLRLLSENAELRAQLEAVGAGGVQPLRASPVSPVSPVWAELVSDATRLAYVADQIRALEPAGSESDVFLTEASQVLRSCATALSTQPAADHIADAGKMVAAVAVGEREAFERAYAEAWNQRDGFSLNANALARLIKQDREGETYKSPEVGKAWADHQARAALATTPDADQADCLKNFRAILNAEINRAIDPSGDIARQEAAIDTTDHLLAEFSKLFPEA